VRETTITEDEELTTDLWSLIEQLVKIGNSYTVGLTPDAVEQFPSHSFGQLSSHGQRFVLQRMRGRRLNRGFRLYHLDGQSFQVSVQPPS
jgi:hypothetical protein